MLVMRESLPVSVSCVGQDLRDDPAGHEFAVRDRHPAMVGIRHDVEACSSTSR